MFTFTSSKKASIYFLNTEQNETQDHEDKCVKKCGPHKRCPVADLTHILYIVITYTLPHPMWSGPVPLLQQFPFNCDIHVLMLNITLHRSLMEILGIILFQFSFSINILYFLFLHCFSYFR